MVVLVLYVRGYGSAGEEEAAGTGDVVGNRARGEFSLLLGRGGESGVGSLAQQSASSMMRVDSAENRALRPVCAGDEARREKTEPAKSRLSRPGACPGSILAGLQAFTAVVMRLQHAAGTWRVRGAPCAALAPDICYRCL